MTRSEIIDKLLAFIGRALRSLWRWMWVSSVICITLGVLTNVLWFNDMLGEECRYYGDAVERCFFMGMNVDALSEIFLTAWALPMVGPFVAVLVPIMMGPIFTFMVWPFYYVAKVALSGFCKLVKRDKPENAEG